MKSRLKSLLIGVAAGAGLAALGLDTSITLSIYGLNFGTYGPLAVIVGVPILLDVAFALALMKGDRNIGRYAMIGTGVLLSLGAGYLLYPGLF